MAIITFNTKKYIGLAAKCVLLIELHGALFGRIYPNRSPCGFIWVGHIAAVTGNTVEEGSSESETTGNGFKNNIPIKVINRVCNYEGKKRLLKKNIKPQNGSILYDSDPLGANFAKWRTLKMKKALIDSAIDRLENSTII